MLQELSALTPYALDRIAEDRAEQLRRLAAVSRMAADAPLLPSVRRTAGRLLVGLGERLLADNHRAGRHLS